jgi:hypothetical protein
MNDDLRRICRVSVCCRAVVLDRYGVWTGVTENVSERGCLLVTGRLLRPGTSVSVTLSSDLFPEELEARGEVVWSAPDLMGVRFSAFPSRPGALSAQAWLERVISCGEVSESTTASRVVPFVQRQPGLRLASPLEAGLALSPPPPVVPQPVVRPLRRA